MIGPTPCFDKCVPQRCSKRDHTAWAFSNALPLWCSDISNVACFLSHSPRIDSPPVPRPAAADAAVVSLGSILADVQDIVSIPRGFQSLSRAIAPFAAPSGTSPWNPDWDPRGSDRPRWKHRDTIAAGADALPPSLSSAPLLVGRDFSVAITRVQIYQITRWVCKSISLEARCMVIMCFSLP